MEILNLEDVKKNHNIETSLGSVLSNGFKIGFKNWGTLVLAGLLFILVCWVPYVNIGAYIGLSGLIIKISKGKKISAVDIFNSYYSRKMADFALYYFLFLGGIIGMVLMLLEIAGYIAVLSGFIPLIVLCCSWSMSSYLIIDKDIGALNSLELSNKITYEYKWTIFGVGALFGLIVLLIGLLILGIFAGIVYIYNPHNPIIGITVGIFFGIFSIIIFTLIFSIGCGISAYLYRILEKRIAMQSHSMFLKSENKSV